MANKRTGRWQEAPPGCSERTRLRLLTNSLQKARSTEPQPFRKPPKILFGRVFRSLRRTKKRKYMEKRKELRNEGRTEKELAESYAFLLLDTSQIPVICEKGLPVGNSKVTILGNPTMGVYLSKYCDILQPNPLDSGRKAEIIIFKIIKGRVKAVFDNTTKNFTPPTPKHDCHVFRNLNRVTSLFTYRAFDLTQFYLYEFGNEGIRPYPRHVCPYAVVSFVYKENKIPKIPKPIVLR